MFELKAYVVDRNRKLSRIKALKAAGRRCESEGDDSEDDGSEDEDEIKKLSEEVGGGDSSCNEGYLSRALCSDWDIGEACGDQQAWRGGGL